MYLDNYAIKNIFTVKNVLKFLKTQKNTSQLLLKKYT